MSSRVRHFDVTGSSFHCWKRNVFEWRMSNGLNYARKWLINMKPNLNAASKLCNNPSLSAIKRICSNTILTLLVLQSFVLLTQLLLLVEYFVQCQIHINTHWDKPFFLTSPNELLLHQKRCFVNSTDFVFMYMFIKYFPKNLRLKQLLSIYSPLAGCFPWKPI